MRASSEARAWRARRRSGIGTLALVAVLLGGLTAPARADEADAPRALADQGRRLYTSYCARCHGMNLVMMSGSFDLRTFPRDGHERFVRSVSKGLRAMPAWESVLKPAEIDAIWAYIGSVNGWTAAGP